MLERLKTRRQFLRIAAENRKWAAPGLVLQAAPRPASDACETTGPRYGLTVTKRVGNAVVRNRIRRRLRAAAEDVLPHCAEPSYDYVLIGRAATPNRDFSDLKEDLRIGLGKLGVMSDNG